VEIVQIVLAAPNTANNNIKFKKMKKIILLLIVILFNNENFAQMCSNPVSIDNLYSNVEVFWCGDQDDVGLPVGEGLMKHIYEDGNIALLSGKFEKGTLNGEGKLVFNENQISEGIFKENRIISGKIILNSDNQQDFYKGNFIENKLHGDNAVHTITNNQGSVVMEGKFIRGSLITGTETEKYNDGLEIIKKYENGDLIGLPVRNDKNYYNVDDIEGDLIYSEIKLKKEGNPNEGISYLIGLEIDGVQGEWVFDTGAMNFSIGMRMFDRLKNSGVKYRDLNQTIKTFGIGGESQGKLVLIDKIKIGNYYLNNVVAEVSLDNNHSLLGIEFLSKFSNVEWSMDKQILKLYK